MDAINVQSATISYNFDSDVTHGNTVLYNAAAVSMGPSGIHGLHVEKSCTSEKDLPWSSFLS